MFIDISSSNPGIEHRIIDLSQPVVENIRDANTAQYDAPKLQGKTSLKCALGRYKRQEKYERQEKA